MQRVFQQLRCLLLRLRHEAANDPEEELVVRAGLPRLLSDDDSRQLQPQGDQDDMCEVMLEEDARRRRLFQHRLQRDFNQCNRPSRTPTCYHRRNTNAGAHVGFQLAHNCTQRAYCCAACGTWIARHQDVIPSDKRAVDISLDDSEVTVCVDVCNIIESKSFVESNATPYWRYEIQRVRCANCNVFLGVKVKTIEKADESRLPLRDAQGHHAINRFNVILGDACGVRLSGPEPHWLQRLAPAAEHEPMHSPMAHCVGRLVRGDAQTEAHSHAGSGVRIEPGTKLDVEQTYLGIRYLRVVNAHSQRPVNAVVPLLCKGCGTILSYTDQLLCTKRRWGFGHSPPERACYMNSLQIGSFELKGEPYEEHLAQGLMDMSDVFCRCGKQVGYKFCTDKTPNGRNHNQVGRFGLVRSCFQKAPYQLAYHYPYRRQE